MHYGVYGSKSQVCVLFSFVASVITSYGVLFDNEMQWNGDGVDESGGTEVDKGEAIFGVI